MNLLSFLITFFISLIISPFVIMFAKKLKLGQNILNYVTEHSTKQGTPTMGGIIFILPTIIVSLFLLRGSLAISILVLAVFLGYGIIGFLDDFVKIKFKRNLGLLPYQKIIFQVLLAVIVAFFVYKNELLGSTIYLPFTLKQINLSWLIIPYVIFVIIATTNSVNLTDGLDGLAGSVTLIFFVAITLISSFILNFYSSSLESEYIEQMQNINIILCSCTGALLGFLVFNFYPAKIFMGDTGSLALGGLMAITCCVNGLSLYIPIIGIMFVVSSVSVIIQVLYYKRTKKRVFLMAPFHHHLQHKGMHETKIVFIYIVVTTIIGVTTYLLLRGL